MFLPLPDRYHLAFNSNSLQIYIRKEREKRDVNKGMDRGEGGREGLEGMTNILRVISHFQ